MKKIQVEVCISKDNIEDKVVLRQGYFEYNVNTTFEELLNYFNIMNVYTDDIYSILHIDGLDRTDLCFEFIIHNGRIVWHFPLCQCTIQEYLDTYSLNKIVLFEPKNIGGLYLPDVDWFVFLDQINKCFTGLSYAITLYEGYKIIKELKNKFILNRKECVTLDTIKKAIKMKSLWSLDEFCYLFDIEQKDGARALLLYAGYIYDEEKNLYFYNKVIEEKNINEFNGLCNELLANKDINEIVESVKGVNNY